MNENGKRSRFFNERAFSYHKQKKQEISLSCDKEGSQ